MKLAPVLVVTLGIVFSTYMHAIVVDDCKMKREFGSMKDAIVYVIGFFFVVFALEYLELKNMKKLLLMSGGIYAGNSLNRMVDSEHPSIKIRMVPFRILSTK